MKNFLLVTLALVFCGLASAQSTDVFVMFGSSFVRPGLHPKANYNIGVGHTFETISKSRFGKIFGDEPTFGYTYENGGSGFFHSGYGSHTMSVGLMKNMNPLGNIIVTYGKKWDKVTFYSWPQIGITSMTGNKNVQNRLYGSYSLGTAIRVAPKSSIWIQETFNKVATVPWYTSTCIGYTYTF